MGFSILIDFDGVLLNNSRLNTKISDRCDRYFSHKTGLSLQTSKKSIELIIKSMVIH